MIRTVRFFCGAVLLALVVGGLIGLGIVGYAKQPLQKSPQLSSQFDPMTFRGLRVVGSNGEWVWFSLSLSPGPLDRWLKLTPQSPPPPVPLVPTYTISSSVTNWNSGDRIRQ